MKIQNISPGKIIPYERNAKKHDEKQVANVAESIKQFGFAQPLVVDKDNILIIGHCRLTAAKRLHLKTVPVVRMDELSPEEVEKLRLLDNKLNESPWDLDILSEDIPALDWEGFDIDWGLPEFEIDLGDIEEVEAPEPPEKPKSKLGDIYELGNHKLICGDSTDLEVIKRLMDGEEADLLLTDPPYNVNYEGKTKDKLKILNDTMEDNSFREFLRTAFSHCDQVLKLGGCFYIWHADSEGYNFRGAVMDVGWTIRQCLIWVKNTMVLGRQDYQWRHEPCLYGWKHEPCLYGWKAGAAHYFTDDRTQTTVIEEKKPNASKEHPTMKPVELMARLIKNSTQKGEIVLDVFGGSGSTLMAAEQLERRAYLAELDPRYVDVIIKRWETFTGKKAKKIKNG